MAQLQNVVIHTGGKGNLPGVLTLMALAHGVEGHVSIGHASTLFLLSRRDSLLINSLMRFKNKSILFTHSILQRRCMLLNKQFDPLFVLGKVIPVQAARLRISRGICIRVVEQTLDRLNNSSQRVDR